MADFVQTLVAAVAGGLMVLAGQLFLEDRRQTSDRTKRRFEKLEELVALSYEHLVASERKDAENMVLLHAKIEAVTAVYLTDFSEYVDQIGSHALDWYTARVQGDEGGAANARKAYMDAHRAFIDGIKQYARREFQQQKTLEVWRSGLAKALSYLPRTWRKET
jgi:hypothetical protein